MILTTILEEAVANAPDKPALIMRMGYRTVELTFGEVYETAKKIACYFEQNGIGVEDKVLLLASNSPYWGCVWWGSILRGSIIVPQNIQNTKSQIEKIIAQTEGKLLIYDETYTDELPEGIKAVDIVKFIEEVEKTDCSGFEAFKAQDDTVAELMYTSGTTGDPKGVILTHHNLASNVDALNKVIPMKKNEVFLSILPLAHIFEQTTCFLNTFYNTSTVVYAHSPKAIVDLLNEYHATKMAAVPEFLQLVMNKIETNAEDQGKGALMKKLMKLSNAIKIKPLQRLLFRSVHKKFGGKLNLVASGGAPLHPELERKWMALGIDLMQGYGLTETSPIISTNNFKEHRFESIGKPLPGIEVKISDDGEILVKGPNVFQGYYKNEEKTKAAFTDDGWFRTDDMGRIDEEGFIFISGRKKYMILGPAGQNVYPEDIEEAMNSIEGVQDCTVLGVEKEGGKEEIHAVLLFEEGRKKTDPEEVVTKANSKLASYQQVNSWTVWPEEDFPRSATRKVRKEKVKEALNLA